MSELLPIFPLPNVVLFPGVFLPLHIFEPRYRDMVGDALLGDRIIGMALLRPGWEREYEGRPPVYPIGCSGVITHFERLPDGRYNIVLRGLERFRIVQEDHALSYRRAAIEPLTDRSIEPADRTAVMNLRVKLQSLVAPAVERSAAEDSGSSGPYARATSAMPDEDLVNALAQ
jgi:Lon protease-like protein